MKRAHRPTNKLERSEAKKKTIEHRQAGTGMYLFRNRSSVASLDLPKASADGQKWIGPGQTWRGDSYFLGMVPREAVLVEEIKQTAEESPKMEKKLILDQPDQITTSGKLEHSVAEENFPLNEESPQEAEAKERLITEDPLAGVTILRD